MKIINLQTVLYIVGLCIIIIGICIGIDAGNSMVVIDSEVQYIFDWFKAFVIGGISAASGLLFFQSQGSSICWRRLQESREWIMNL